MSRPLSCLGGGRISCDPSDVLCNLRYGWVRFKKRRCPKYTFFINSNGENQLLVIQMNRIIILERKKLWNIPYLMKENRKITTRKKEKMRMYPDSDMNANIMALC